MIYRYIGTYMYSFKHTYLCMYRGSTQIIWSVELLNDEAATRI